MQTKNHYYAGVFQTLIICVFLPLFAISQPKKRKVVFVIADGIPADVIEKVSKPHLDQIIHAGTYKRAFVGGIKDSYNQTPTISAPGYNDLLTGVWGNKHNVLNNDISAPNYHYWTIFRYLKNQYPGKKTAVFSSWQDNRTKLIGDGKSETGGYAVDIAFDGFELDTVQFKHDKKSAYMHRIDETVVNKADSTIRASAPDLSWVYLEYTDDMGHAYGDGEPLYKAVSYLDDQMGRIWNAVQYREKNFGEEWLMFITTDHGRDATTGKNHGGQSDRERTTWMITNYPKPNEYFKSTNPAIVDILPSIAQFLKITIPEKNRNELDGVSIIDPVSIANPTTIIRNDSLLISWKAFEKKGTIMIQVAATNNFKEGGEDTFQNLATVALSDQKYAIPLRQLPAGYCKIQLIGNKNVVNTEVIISR